jgi:hypothetical protein
MLPDSIFGSSAAAAVMKSAGIELGTKLGDAIKQHGKKEQPKAAKEKIDEVTAEVKKGFVLKMDSMGNLHVPDCPNVIRFELAMPRPPKPKKGQSAPTAPGLPTISIEKAISSGMSVSPCCSGDVEAVVKKQAASKEAPKDVDFTGRSAAYVLGSATPEQIEKINEWLESLTPAKTRKVIEGMKHLDSMQELAGLLAIPQDKRIKYLDWLKEDREKAKATLLLIGQFVAKYGKITWAKIEQAWNDAKQWDKDNFKALADEAEVKLRTPRKKATFRDMWKIFG